MKRGQVAGVVPTGAVRDETSLRWREPPAHFPLAFEVARTRGSIARMDDDVPAQQDDAFEIFDRTSKAIEEGRLDPAAYGRALARLDALRDRSEGPDHDRAQRYVEWLGEMWADATGGPEQSLPQLDEAERLMHEALREQPDERGWLRLIGATMDRIGDLSREAPTSYRRAFDLTLEPLVRLTETLEARLDQHAR